MPYRDSSVRACRVSSQARGPPAAARAARATRCRRDCRWACSPHRARPVRRASGNNRAAGLRRIDRGGVGARDVTHACQRALVQRAARTSLRARPGHGADDLVHQLSALEEQDRGDRAHVELASPSSGWCRRRAWPPSPCRVVGRQLLHDRRDHAARRAPRGPEIHHGEALMPLDLRRKVLSSFTSSRSPSSAPFACGAACRRRSQRDVQD